MERLPKVVARRRRTYAHAKGKMPERGLDVRRLRHILDIPMDIFFEVHLHFLHTTCSDLSVTVAAQIASYLEPLDLLHLSRVSRKLRSIF